MHRASPPQPSDIKQAGERADCGRRSVHPQHRAATTAVNAAGHIASPLFAMVTGKTRTLTLSSSAFCFVCLKTAISATVGRSGFCLHRRAQK